MAGCITAAARALVLSQWRELFFVATLICPFRNYLCLENVFLNDRLNGATPSGDRSDVVIVCLFHIKAHLYSRLFLPVAAER